MGELLRRGVLAALTPKNAPEFDILAADRRRTVYIRVKTRSKGDWRWNAESGEWDAPVFRRSTRGRTGDDFCILVDLKNAAAPARFFVVQTGKLEKRLRAQHKEWLETPGKRGQPHSPVSKLRTLRDTSRFLTKIPPNNWNALGLEFQTGS